MSHDEVQDLREDMAEMKSDIKGIQAGIADLRVLIAGNYVTKNEFEKHKESEEERFEKHITDERATRWKWATFIVAASGLIMAFLQYLRG